MSKKNRKMSHKKENRRSLVENNDMSVKIKKTSIDSKYEKVQIFYRNEAKNRKNISNSDVKKITELNKSRVYEKDRVNKDEKRFKDTINDKSGAIKQLIISKSSFWFWDSWFKSCFPHYNSSIEILDVSTPLSAKHQSNESFFTRKFSHSKPQNIITKEPKKQKNNKEYKSSIGCSLDCNVGFKISGRNSKAADSFVQISKASSEILFKDFSYEEFFNKKKSIKITRSLNRFFDKSKQENTKAHFANNFSDNYITKKWLSDESVFNKKKINNQIFSETWDERMFEYDQNSKNFKDIFNFKNMHSSRESQKSVSCSESLSTLVNGLSDLFSNEKATTYLAPFYDNIHTKQSAVEMLIERYSFKKIFSNYNAKKVIEATEKIKKRDQLEAIVEKNENLFIFILMLLVLRVLKEPAVKKDLKSMWENVTKTSVLEKDVEELKKLKLKLGKFWELQRDGRLDILRAQKFVKKANQILSRQKEKFPPKSHRVVHNCSLIFRLIKVLQLKNIREAEQIFACAKGKVFNMQKKQYILLKKLFKAIQITKKCVEIVTGFEAYRKDLAKKISFFAKKNEFS